MKRIRTIIAGNLVKQAVYTVPTLADPKNQRAEKSRATNAAQSRMNYRNSAEHLEFLAAANFTENDYFLTLTVRDEPTPASKKQMQKPLRRFFRILRNEYRRSGKELRYIYTLEGYDSEETRLHTHILINRLNTPERDAELYQSMWDLGFIECQPLKLFLTRNAIPSDNMFSAIANYMCVDAFTPNGAQRYSPSRNLCKPINHYEDMPDSVTLAEPPTGAIIIDRDSRESLYGNYKYVKYLLPAIPLTAGNDTPIPRKRRQPSAQPRA